MPHTSSQPHLPAAAHRRIAAWPLDACRRPARPRSFAGWLVAAWLLAEGPLALGPLLAAATGATGGAPGAGRPARAAVSPRPADPPHRAATGAPIAGAVASGHALATAAGLDVLRQGGNAVDAAVATALALAVVYPEAGNLGGGGFAVTRMHGEAAALDFRETAPAAARRGMYLDAGGRPVPDASKVGPLAAGVPGSPAGLYELHHALGRLPWPRVVAPALGLARDGFVVDAHLGRLLAAAAQRRLLGRFPESAAVWLPHGQPPPVGSRLRLPALAATLAAYAEHGPPAILAGPVGAAIAAASRRHGGVLTTADLAAYRPLWRQPLRFAAFGWQIASMPPPSAGGVVLGQVCGMLERLGWAALPPGGADRAHLLAEAFRRAFADRVLLGDPAGGGTGPAALLDPRWIAARAAGIDRERATPSAALGPWPGPAAPVGGAGHGETTHLSAIDGEGNAVALTTTLNGLFGCGLYVPEIGFLNNEMDDFATTLDAADAADAARTPTAASAAPGAGRPPRAGWTSLQGEANAVSPGKRMLSSMTPTIAWRDDEVIALGGRGSLRIPTHVTQVLLDLLVDHAPLQAAVDRPRLHHQGLPDVLEAEPGALSPETARELARRGHRIVVAGPDDSARIAAVRRLTGAKVPRHLTGTEVTRQPAGAAGRLPAAVYEAAVDPRGAAAVGGQGVLAPGTVGEPPQ